MVSLSFRGQQRQGPQLLPRTNLADEGRILYPLNLKHPLGLSVLFVRNFGHELVDQVHFPWFPQRQF